MGEFDQQKCWVRSPSYHPRNWARAPKTVLGQVAVTGKSVKWGGPFWPGSHFRQERRAACPKNTRSNFSDFFGQFLWVLLKFWGQCYVCWPFISPPGRPSLWSRNIVHSWYFHASHRHEFLCLSIEMWFRWWMYFNVREKIYFLKSLQYYMSSHLFKM